MKTALRFAAIALLAAFASAPLGQARATTLTVVDVRTFSLCDADPGGDCYSATVDAAYVNAIFAQIGLTINFAAAYTTAFNFAWVNATEIDPGAALNGFAATVFNSPAYTSNTAYVGFTPDMYGTTIGISTVDNVIYPVALVQAVGYTIQQYSIIFAHELAHVLGATHANAVSTSDLEYPRLSPSSNTVGFLPSISDANAAEILSSSLLYTVETPDAEVPVAASLPLLCSGLLALGWRRRRARRASAG